MNPASLSELRSTFGDRMQENVPLSGYTAARIGGPADVLVFVRTADELVQAAEKAVEDGSALYPAGRRFECAGQ